MASRVALFSVVLLFLVGSVAAAQPAGDDKSKEPSHEKANPKDGKEKTGDEKIPAAPEKAKPENGEKPAKKAGKSESKDSNRSDEAEQSVEAKKVDEAFAGVSTLEGSSISAELLQIVGQVVVDRATEVGWTILRNKLKQALKCSDSATSFPATCKVLATLRIQDVLASPQGLLDGSMSDLSKLLQEKLKAKLPSSNAVSMVMQVSVGLGGVLALWSGGHKGGASGVVYDTLRDAVKKVAAQTCPAESDQLPLDLPSMRALHGVALCLIEHHSGNPPLKQRLKACDLVAEMEGCGDKDEKTLAAAKALKMSLLAKESQDQAEGIMSFITRGAAERVRTTKDDLCFASKDTDKKNNLCAALIEDLGVLTVGVIRQDWSRVTQGAVGALDDYGAFKGETLTGRKFYKLLAAIGQYALTYRHRTDDSASTESASKARAEVVKSLVKQMTNREQRTGWVFSVGGSFGLGWMYRAELGGDTTGSSGPFILPIGLGLQYYPKSCRLGFHVQLGLFDLGQYVTFEDNHETTVGTPDVKAAFAPSVTVGAWFGPKSAPIFLGGYGGIAPFVLANGKPELFVGGMLGAYVPLLDF